MGDVPRPRRRFGRDAYECGAVTFVQRSGDALNLNVHFHTLALDGVVSRDGRGAARFRALPPPTDAEVERTTRRIVRSLRRLLLRRGLVSVSDADACSDDTLADDEPLLAEIYSASVRSRTAIGERAGRRVLRVGDLADPEEAAFLPGPRCASIDGVSLHANVSVPARDRRRLEKLCRYVGRPPVATQRLSQLDDGRLLYKLKHRWRDGTTLVIFDRLELGEKLAALVPPPRFRVVRYHGVLAARAGCRREIVRERRQPAPAPRRSTVATPAVTRGPARTRSSVDSDNPSPHAPTPEITPTGTLERLLLSPIRIAARCLIGA